MKLLTLISFLFIVLFTHAQNMNNEQLAIIIAKKADTISGTSGNWQFMYNKVPMICITDTTNNRMRIIAPITSTDKLDKDLLLDSLTANFHSALDVKYAISNGIMWSAYIHPLKELSNNQLESALNQVYLAAITFGSTFSSTEFIFGGNTLENKKTEEKEILKKDKTRKF